MNGTFTWMTRALGAFLLIGFAGLTPQAEAQCVENHSGYSAKVRWYKKADWEYRKQTVNLGFKNMPYWIALAGSGPVREENVNNNPGAENSRVCYGSDNVVVVTVRGGIYSKIFIWAAVAVAMGATCVAADSLCEVAWELGLAGGSAATSNIPDAKEAIWASEVAPGKAVILRGLTTDVKVIQANLNDYNRKCNADTEGMVCYKDNDDRGTCTRSLCNRN